jgi:16S rRNA G966 N2-methylase RsmD
LNTSILNTEIQEFINKNLNSDITTILLKGTPFSSVQTNDIVEQIESKKRSEKKLPTWFNSENIYFPNRLNIEQTSSEITAKYKSSMISGDTIIDLTGGFGIDCYYFSKVFQTVEYCEVNETLSKIVKHNYKQLKIQNINAINTDGIEYLNASKNKYDWIYIDPSRRHDSKGKVFFLKDCLPNVTEHLNLLFKKSKNILIKTSPFLDISIGIKELKHVKSIHIIAVNNEVKELLWVLESGFDHNIVLKTVNLKKNNHEFFNFLLEDEKQLDTPYSLPLTYLYEPNSAILKAGGFQSVSKHLNVFKLHKHSHLYTSELEVDFPGRAFKIEKIIVYNRKELKKLGVKKANITTRNFPESVQNIRKKFNISDGGSNYLFFTTDINNNKIIISTLKLK